MSAAEQIILHIKFEVYKYYVIMLCFHVFIKHVY